MSSYISKNKKLLVISDTRMYVSDEGVKAFGPVVKELNELSSIYNQITWIGFHMENERNNNSFLEIENDCIKVYQTISYFFK